MPVSLFHTTTVSRLLPFDNGGFIIDTPGVREFGIIVSPPNINDSSYTFTPVVKDNVILYGLRGITRLSISTIKDILDKRPFASIEDFLERVKINKLQMLNLIKCGAFDAIEKLPREEIMHKYLLMIADRKQRLTLQNMQMLITKKLIPESMTFYSKVFLFNKFLKTQKNDDCYVLNDAAVNFIADNFHPDLIDNGVNIRQTKWDAIYKKTMEPMREYLKDHKYDTVYGIREDFDEANVYGYVQDITGLSERRWRLELAASGY